MKNIHLSALRLLAVYWIPIIAGILTIAIILTAATTTYLVAKDTLGPWVTALALGLYGLGLAAIFAWVMIRFQRPGTGEQTQGRIRVALFRVLYPRDSKLH